MTYRAKGTAHPVRTNDAFRWLLSGSGFWLCLSPLLLFNTDSLTAGELNTETVTLMGFGFIALVLAAMIHGHHHMVQTLVAVLFAIGLGASPWLIGYLSHPTATINAWAISWIILIIAIHQAIRTMTPANPTIGRYRKTAHQFQPFTFI